MKEEPLLKIRDLSVSLRGARTVYALNRVQLQIHRGETYVLLGESGSGKSLTALSILRLLPPSARVNVLSEIRWKNENLLTYSEARMQQVRGQSIGMIFQEP